LKSRFFENHASILIKEWLGGSRGAKINDKSIQKRCENQRRTKLKKHKMYLAMEPKWEPKSNPISRKTEKCIRKSMRKFDADKWCRRMKNG
jgi:hypothetical protein